MLPALPRPAGSRRCSAERIAQAFTVVEDVVYVGLGLPLTASAVALLVDGVLAFGRSLLAVTMPGRVIAFLDRILLVLIIVEVLYTVPAFRGPSRHSRVIVDWARSHST